MSSRQKQYSPSPDQRFGIMAAVSIVVLLIIFATYGYFDRKNLLTRGNNAAVQIAEETALSGAATLDMTQKLLAAMRLLVKPPVRNASPDHDLVRAELLNLKQQTPHVMDLLIISAQGEITNWTGTGSPPDIRDRDYFSVHRDAHNVELHIGKPLLSKVHLGSWFFAISQALRDEQGNLSEVLVIIVDVDLLRERLGFHFAVPGSTQLLVDDSGLIYTREPEYERYVGKHILHPQKLAGLSPTTPSASFQVAASLDDQQRIIAFHQLPGYSITAVGTISVPDLLAAWTQRLQIVIFLWVVLSLCIILAAKRSAALSREQVLQANTDGLTGIRNRRAIMTCASDLENDPSGNGPLSLLMIDIDHFKRINDHFGHPAGDAVICSVAELLRNNIRSTDIVGRYGGEEFLVLMPHTTSEGAATVAEKLRMCVEDGLHNPQPITISIGIATLNSLNQSLDSALIQADAALYRAKEAGRNCIRIASQTTDPTQPAAPLTRSAL